MKQSHFIPKLFILIFLFIIIKSFGQSTHLIYKEKGKNKYTVKIYFSNKEGEANISPIDIMEYENVYFTIVPDENDNRGYFRESDIKDCFPKIRLMQDNAEVLPAGDTKPLQNANGKIDHVIISFPKNDIILYNSFCFVNDVDTSEKIRIREKYLPSYNKYKEIYISGDSLTDEKKYIDAFETLLPIWDDSRTNDEIKTYSFYSHATMTLPITTIEQFVDSLCVVYNNADKDFYRNISEQSLKKCDSVYNLISQGRTIFDSYLHSDIEGVPDLKNKYDSLLNKMDSLVKNKYNVFNRNKMLFLETGNYSVYKFDFFIDVFTLLITHADSLMILDRLYPVDLELLNKIPEKKEELENTGWMNDFKILVKLINENIEKNGILLNNSVMNNLQLLVPYQKQPYYDILLAFNELSGNLMLFRDFLNNAITKCTNENLIKNLEMWLLSSRLTYMNVDQKCITQINNGIKLIEQNKLVEAENLFNIITRQANQVAPPWYYLGEIQYKNNQLFSSEAQFNKALEIYPQYIAPRHFVFEILLHNGSYDELLVKVNNAISAFDIWYFHFIKAKTFYYLGKYNSAINEIKNYCININPWDIEQYFLLGDAYLEKNDFGNAKNAYMKTQKIDPFSDSKAFNNKMQSLQEKKEGY